MENAEIVRERIRHAFEGQPRKRTASKRWLPPNMLKFRRGSVLAFDQTIMSTGWALLEKGEAPQIVVRKTGMCYPLDDELTGFEATYTRALDVDHQLSRIISQFKWSEDIEVVHEMPAVAGHRTESSLLVGYSIRRLAAEAHLPVAMISKQSAEALLLPPELRGTKKEIGKAILPFLDRTHLLVGSPWNQHVHDAIAVGLKYLYEV